MAIGEIKTLVFSDGVSVSAPAAAPVAVSVSDASNWNGSQTSVNYDVSTLGPDSRLAQWVLKNDSGGHPYKQIMADIFSPDATHVTVSVDEPLAAGTYYLIGVY